MNKGLGLVPTISIGVQSLEAFERSVDSDAVKGLGENPAIFQLKLDDGAIAQFAVPADVAELARGPFLENNRIDSMHEQEPVQQ